MKRILILMAVMGMFALPTAQADKKSEKEIKVMGETRPGEALVYFIRNLYAVRLKTFCDNQLVANLPYNSYTFAYLQPGTHIVWMDRIDSAPFDFAAGHTYYLDLNDSLQLLILSAAEGQAAIEKIKYYVEVSEADRRKASGTLAKKWPKVKAKVEREFALMSEAIDYTPPATTENMVKVPAGTAIPVELMENLNSGINRANDAVWVRASKDVHVDGRLFVLKGTPVKARLRGVKDARNFGRMGRLDLTIVSLTSADGTVCPLIGQKATIGAQGHLPGGTATGVAVLALMPASIAPAIIAAAFIKGGESFHLAGEEIMAFTRQDIWIKPLESTGAPGSPAKISSDSVKAYALGNVTYDIAKGEVPKSVEIVIESAADLASLELFRVADSDIPAPVRPNRLSRTKEGWVAQFDGWAIARYLRFSEEGNQPAFRLTAPDGTVTVTQAKVLMVFKHKQASAQ